MPRKRFSCFIPLGSWIASIACTLLLWGLIPFLVNMYPRYYISSAQDVNFSAFTFKPALQSCLSTCHVFLDGLQDYSLRCRGGHLNKLAYTLGISLALTFLIGICLENLQCPPVVISCSCRNIFPKERWWCKFWMHLDPIYVEIKGCCKREFF